MRFIITLFLLSSITFSTNGASSPHVLEHIDHQPNRKSFVPPKKIKRREKLKKVFKTIRVIFGISLGLLLCWLGFGFIKILLLSTGTGIWFFLLDLSIILLGFYLLFPILLVSILIAGGQIGCRAPTTIKYNR